jgi:hypothetical protein
LTIKMTYFANNTDSTNTQIFVLSHALFGLLMWISLDTGERKTEKSKNKQSGEESQKY